MNSHLFFSALYSTWCKLVFIVLGKCSENKNKYIYINNMNRVYDRHFIYFFVRLIRFEIYRVFKKCVSLTEALKDPGYKCVTKFVF